MRGLIAAFTIMAIGLLLRLTGVSAESIIFFNAGVITGLVVVALSVVIGRKH